MLARRRRPRLPELRRAGAPLLPPRARGAVPRADRGARRPGAAPSSRAARRPGRACSSRARSRSSTPRAAPCARAGSRSARSAARTSRSPASRPLLARWTRELRDGRGFLLLRGLPVARWGDEDSALVYWGLGQHLGRPGAQNPEGELLGHVVDTHEEATQPARASLSHARRDPLPLRSRRRGGPALPAHGARGRREPDHQQRLHLQRDPRAPPGPGGAALRALPARLARRAARRARARTSRCLPAATRAGASRPSGTATTSARWSDTPDVAPFTALERELLDLYEELAGSRGAAARHAVRARRRAADLEPHGRPRAHGVRGRTRGASDTCCACGSRSSARAGGAASAEEDPRRAAPRGALRRCRHADRDGAAGG